MGTAFAPHLINCPTNYMIFVIHVWISVLSRQYQHLEALQRMQNGTMMWTGGEGQRAFRIEKSPESILSAMKIMWKGNLLLLFILFEYSPFLLNSYVVGYSSASISSQDILATYCPRTYIVILIVQPSKVLFVPFKNIKEYQKSLFDE